MNPTDPNDIEELVMLDRILEANGFTVETRDAQALEYSYPCFSKNNALGRAFGEAAEKLVSESGGKLTVRIKSGGFVAVFPDDEKRMEFLKAFSNAARALYTPPELPKIVTTERGIKLGAKARRGIYS